jgi:multidrug resistance protein, MATE family
MIAGSVPVMISYAYTEETLLLAGQLPEVAYLAGIYAKWLIIGVLPTMVARASVRYLQMRGLVYPSMITGFISLILNIILNFILISGVGSWPGLGFIGAAISTVLSRIFSLIALWLYMYYFKPSGFTWTGWHADAFSTPVILEFLKFGVPSSLMFWLEETSFNLLTLLVGILHLKTATVASAVALSVLVISFVIPIAFGSAAASRLGYLLGANRPKAARAVAVFAAKTAAAFMVVNSLTLYVFRRGVVNLFLSQAEQTDEVVQTILSVLSVLCVTLYFDGQQIVAGCLIRGVGYPTSGFVTNLIAHYVITNPIGALLAFVFGFGVMGFYYGLTLGLMAAGAIYAYILMRVDWVKAAAEAHKLYTEENSSEDTKRAVRAVEIDIVPDTA